MEENKDKIVETAECLPQDAEKVTTTDATENENCETKNENSEEVSAEKIQNTEKTKLTFDEKVDATAGFIKKYKIALLCGIIAVLALVIGLFVGSAFGGNDDANENSGYQAGVVEDDGKEDVSLTTSPAVTVAPTVAPELSSEPEGGTSTQEEAVATASPEVVVITYVDLLDSKVYFAESVDIAMSEADVISLLNNVLTASEEAVTAEGAQADGKAEMADSVNVSVTKAEMKALLDDLGATFTNIDQSVSGDILTLDVDMNINIPEEVLTEVKANSDLLTKAALMVFGTNFSFSYQVSYQMDGESLIPIEVTESTIDIGGLGEDMTKTIAGVALSSYSSADVDTATLLAGYNSMAGEIIADVLNNYGIVTGATSSEINITTRTKD